MKSLKALPNADLSLGQVKADSGETFIPVALEDAVTYWTILSGQGNKKAAALLGALAIEALKRRVDHRLGTIKEEEEYEAYTDMVCTRLMARKAWTDTLRDHHMKLYGTSPTPEQYKDWTVTVNLALFNQKHFNCDRTENMTPDQQRLIIDFERTATRMTSKYPTATPGKIIEKALLTF
ncbi:hypothetical protein [Crocosphaera sp.]|uniref:hypothetical protein n=1 Tax=Crocosphaera sp. TaxID=2729996 RepID=UPI00261D31BB|nr:hypothetical protein [Crocosphaera sp.]